MIQDIFPHQLNNQYDAHAKPEQDDYVLCFRQSDVLTKKTLKNGSEMIELPKISDFGEGGTYTYLFSVDEERYFLLEQEQAVNAEKYEYINVRELENRGLQQRYRVYAAMTGKHLADWYRDTKFCGRCGHPMVHSGTERAMVCQDCGNTVYPRIMPAVIVGVKNGDQLLLTRYRRGFAQNALIAGFTEIGETVEETVAREVMEEAGLHVKNLTYYKSQPWGVANDILMGFYCDVDGDTEIHMDAQELKYAQWVNREDIQLQKNDFSLTNEMMQMFKEGRIH